jgi:hypothetical protein
LQKSYVFSIDGSGDPVTINQEGAVIICYYDTGELKQIADLFNALVKAVA